MPVNKLYMDYNSEYVVFPNISNKCTFYMWKICFIIIVIITIFQIIAISLNTLFVLFPSNCDVNTGESTVKRKKKMFWYFNGHKNVWSPGLNLVLAAPLAMVELKGVVEYLFFF